MRCLITFIRGIEIKKNKNVSENYIDALVKKPDIAEAFIDISDENYQEPYSSYFYHYNSFENKTQVVSEFCSIREYLKESILERREEFKSYLVNLILRYQSINHVDSKIIDILLRQVEEENYYLLNYNVDYKFDFIKNNARLIDDAKQVHELVDFFIYTYLKYKILIKIPRCFDSIIQSLGSPQLLISHHNDAIKFKINFEIVDALLQYHFLNEAVPCPSEYRSLKKLSSKTIVNKVGSPGKIEFSDEKVGFEVNRIFNEPKLNRAFFRDSGKYQGTYNISRMAKHLLNTVFVNNVESLTTKRMEDKIKQFIPKDKLPSTKRRN